MPATSSKRPRLEALSAEEVVVALQALPDWRVVALGPCGSSGPSGLSGSDASGAPARQGLQRLWRFASFPQAMSFLQTLVEPLEALNHHPRIENNWRTLTLTFTTWDGGQQITLLDVQAAGAVDRLCQAFEGT